MNFSTPFIHRPIGTTLLAIGLFLAGLVAYRFLPVASLPTVELPTISVSASQPGADPVTMAATVAAPLERHLGEIAGVTEMTSVSSLGMTRVILQFDISRSADGAARDVQAAINAAAADLPADMPALPSFRKANPAAAPVLILALTSDTIPPSAIYDAADSVVAQRISQVDGVADVTVSGAEQPAIRVRLNPTLLASMGVSLEEVRQAIVAANAIGPLGIIDGDRQALAIDSDSQLRTPEDYKAIVIKAKDGNIIRLSAVASVERGTRNTRSAAMFNKKPAVLLIITKQGDANVIETVDRIKALIPEIKRWIPAGVDISVLSDRTGTIRASVLDMQLTLGLAIVLVMLVVFVFLRRSTPTLAAGIAVPLSLAGTCCAMWALGYSINNLTLMALAVSVGFVVDDAIVMIENMYRNLERGVTPFRAAIEGARQIGFTIVSISISLVAAFIPLLFMGGVVGRVLREFSVTLAVAILVSMVVSLSVTPMICAHFVRHAPNARSNWFDRLVEGTINAMIRAYSATLRVTLRHNFLTIVVMAATVVLTVQLYVQLPKGFFPRDDTGLMFGATRASPDISFEAMSILQKKALDIVLSDPAVAGVGSSVGGSRFNASVNQGRMFVSLKPRAERGGVTTQEVVNRLRRRLYRIQGLSTFLVPASDIRIGGRQSRSEFQFTLWSANPDDLYAWVPRVLDRVRQIPGLEDVDTDREQGGLQASITIDRQAAARLGVPIQAINAALNNAFAQRQISTIYGDRNQYRVILEVDRHYQRDPNSLASIFVSGRGGIQVPLTTVVKIERRLAPLVINQQG
ncbi:MAG: efflux RND transporter permease subunit, partial [Hyphomicrobiaceae bacterium]